MNEDLITELASFSSDPLGFAYYGFEWGKGELVKFARLEDWQEELLIDLGRGVITVQEAIARAESTVPLRFARTSGHGIGKSALVAIIILWAISTFEDTIGVVTANTENQLKTKTWKELAVWYRRFIGRDLFKLTATSLYSVDPDHEKTWKIDMVPWSERNTEAFAGLHNQGKRILLIFDEGSAIPDLIYEVAEGALTDEATEIIWACFGNPTRNKGRFRDCFAGGKFAHRWSAKAIDSRSVRITNKPQIAEWIADYGEDSDFVRVRVRGIFPRIDAESFIPYELAFGSVNREIEPQSASLILGVDVGRFGDDPSVIVGRRGRDWKPFTPIILPGLSVVQLAARIAAEFNAKRPVLVIVDEGGVGGGVVDILRTLNIPVLGVDFGGKSLLSQTPTKVANNRAFIWHGMREALPGASLPNIKTSENTDLVDELTGPTYTLNNKEEIQLESKKEMRARGVPSPNVADAYACTFAYPTYELPLDLPDDLQSSALIEVDYNPFSPERLFT